MSENIGVVVLGVFAKNRQDNNTYKNCRNPKTRSSKKQVLFETLQSVQSVELFNFKRAPRARERQGTPGSAREAPNPYIYLKNAPDL